MNVLVCVKHMIRRLITNKDGDEIKMREIAPGHFVYCSEEEEVMYKEKHAKLTAEAAAK